MNNIRITWDKPHRVARDNRGNTATVDRWGSEYGAMVSLLSLESCSRCHDCSDMRHCSDCTGCSGCYGCSRCANCSRCYGCSDPDVTGTLGDLGWWISGKMAGLGQLLMPIVGWWVGSPEAAVMAVDYRDGAQPGDILRYWPDMQAIIYAVVWGVRS